MKNTLREASMYYRKGKGVHASSLLKSFKVLSLLRPPVSPTCSEPLKKEGFSPHQTYPRLPEKLSQPSSLSWKFMLVYGGPSVPWGSPQELWIVPRATKAWQNLGFELCIPVISTGSLGEMWLHPFLIKSLFLPIYLSFSLL